MAAWQGFYQFNLVAAGSQPEWLNEPATSHLSAVMVGRREPKLACPTLRLIEDCVHIVPGHVAMSQADVP
jgi:hypothetical protein